MSDISVQEVDSDNARRDKATQKSSYYHRCDFCNKCCRSRASLRLHLKSHVCKDRACISCTPLKPCSDSSESDDESDDAAPSASQAVCSKRKIQETSLLKIGLGNCAKKISRVETCVVAKKNPAKHTFFCTECNRNFVKKKNLQKHEAAHCGGFVASRPFKCLECGNFFATKFNLRRHESLHSPSKPHICSTCNMKFAHKYYLQVHLSSHQDIKRHICVTCDSVFKTKYGLSKHLSSHQDVYKKYICVTCDGVFKSKNGLSKHRRKACRVDPS